MTSPEAPDDVPAASAGPLPDEARRLAPWECYFRSISDSLRILPGVHPMPDREDHARWAERHAKLEKDAQVLAQRIERRTNTVARTFDRVCEVLGALDYLRDDEVTDGQHRGGVAGGRGPGDGARRPGRLGPVAAGWRKPAGDLGCCLHRADMA